MQLSRLFFSNATWALAFFCLGFSPCGLGANELKYEVVQGKFLEETDGEGRRVVRGSRSPGSDSSIKPRLRFVNVPDGEFAIELQTRVHICYPSTTVLVRGKKLGEGMILTFHGGQAWRAFRNNLGPGHIDPGSPPDKQSFGYSSSLYDTKTLTSTLYEDYPELLDAEHPHSKTEEWWTLKVQVWNGRFMAKGWLEGTSEPEGWLLDFPVDLDESGPVGLDVGDPSWLRNMRIAPVEPGKFLFVDRDHREKRFGPPLDDYVIDVELEETKKDITVRGDLVELVFDRSRCGIRVAQLRQELFPVESLPDLKLVDSQGREYRQRYAEDGDLKRLADEPAWWVFSGRCTPRTADGQLFPHPFRFNYRVHRQSGLLHVDVEPISNGSKPVFLRQLALVHELADVPGQELDAYQVVASEPDNRFFGLGNRALVHASREDGILISSPLLIGTWGNGRYAFQVTPKTYSQCVIDAGFDSDPKSYHHLAVGTRGGHRFLDMVYINRRAGTEICLCDLPGPVRFEHTFSFLPWRRYRPRVELFCGSQVCGDTGLHNVDVEQERLRYVAELGATLHCHGYPPMGLLAPSIEQERVGRQIREAHFYGLKDKVSWVLGTNWIGAWPSYPHMRPFELGWVTKEEAFRGRRLVPLKAGQVRKEDPEIPVEMCVGAEVTRRLAVDHITMPVVDKFKSSAVYWDWTWPIYPCANADHGDDPSLSMTPLGHVALVDRFRRESARRAWKPLIMGCTYDAHCTPVSLLDMFNPGEAGKGWYVPNPAEHDLIYSSLLYGTQCVYHTYGGLALDSPRTYELALAHCSTVMVVDDFNDAPHHDPAGTPGGGSEREREMWARYMTPLTIFGVNRSEYRHPYDGDYEEYCESSPGVTAVLYFRDGRALIVVVKDRDGVKDGKLSLNPKRLGVNGDRLLLFDVIEKTAAVVSTANEKLDLSVDLVHGPRFFLLERLPDSPKPIWFSPNTWQAALERRGDMYELRLGGVPTTTLACTLWCGVAGSPTFVGGGINSYESGPGLVVVESMTDMNAESRVLLRWDAQE